MKMNKIKEMSSPDLEKELGELKTELFKLRFSLATHGLDNPMKIKEVKKMRKILHFRRKKLPYLFHVSLFIVRER